MKNHTKTKIHSSFLGISLLAMPALAQYSPPSSGLVAWWRGEGNANDSSGNGHTGTLLGGMGFTTGEYGQAFDAGSNKRVFVPDNPAFQLTSLSMGAWINVNALSYFVLFRGDERTGLDPYLMGLNLLGGSGSNILFGITDGGNNSASVQTPIPFNQWVQVTSTFDGTTGDMRLYVNGILKAETFTPIRPMLALDGSSNAGVDIGNVDPSNDFPFLGAIDEAVLYNRALSPTEVMSLVPEPGSAALYTVGAGLFWLIRRRRVAANKGKAFSKSYERDLPHNYH